ncbi:MAG TPA: thioredoxin family protein [Kofleriaceae bacterium]|nr:thioredoxin family protein [Kofleriaceae bacterium]
MKLALACIAVIGCASATKPDPDMTWLTDETAAFTQARAEHKGVAIVFAAAWSVPDVELRRELERAATTELLAPAFVGLRVDCTDETPAIAELRTRYHATTLPHLVFLRSDGLVLGRIDRLVTGDELRAQIRDAAAKR